MRTTKVFTGVDLHFVLVIIKIVRYNDLRSISIFDIQCSLENILAKNDFPFPSRVHCDVYCFGGTSCKLALSDDQRRIANLLNSSSSIAESSIQPNMHCINLCSTPITVKYSCLPLVLLIDMLVPVIKAALRKWHYTAAFNFGNLQKPW